MSSIANMDVCQVISPIDLYSYEAMSTTVIYTFYP